MDRADQLQVMARGSGKSRMIALKMIDNLDIDFEEKKTLAEILFGIKEEEKYDDCSIGGRQTEKMAGSR